MTDIDPVPSLASRMRRLVLGGARDPQHPDTFHKLALIAFFAWVGLGADGLSSSCYGPSEAFMMLREHMHLALFVALASAFTIVVIATCYAQIIELFPTGGGGYLVASRLLTPKIGMVSGCALCIDYVLTVSVSVATGTDAIFSFIPGDWHHLRLWFALLGVIVLTGMNMRGVKESVLPLLPVFLFFLISHVFAIIYSVISYSGRIPSLAADTSAEVQSIASNAGVFALLYIILHAYSMGAGTYTGIEAVSNGLPILREPKVKTGKRTMLYMAASLVFMVLGLMLAYLLAGVRPDPSGIKTLNAVWLETITGGWNSLAGQTFVRLTLFSEAAILFVAAQTGYLGGPRVIANMALDRWFPSRFAMLSDRLVTQNGVVLIGGAAFLTMALTRGSVEILLTLYSITVFITFVLSQLGMCRHWWRNRKEQKPWTKGLAINGLGLALTSFILVSLTLVKFRQGGWVTLVITGGLVVAALAIRRHYTNTTKLLGRLDALVAAAGMSPEQVQKGTDQRAQQECVYDKNAKTAVILVNGFNGLGLHTLFNVIRMFGGTFKNFVFIQVGAVDAGVFKGAAEIENLKDHIRNELDRYVQFMNREGYYAEAFSSLGTDIVEEVTKLVPQILERFPHSIFFGGQLVFPEETVFTRWLHNYIVFATQRKLYSRGIPFMILPIRV